MQLLVLRRVSLALALALGTWLVSTVSGRRESRAAGGAAVLKFACCIGPSPSPSPSPVGEAERRKHKHSTAQALGVRCGGVQCQQGDRQC